MGLSVLDLHTRGVALEMTAPFMFNADTVPHPRPGFDRYLVRVTPHSGLSMVKAVSRFIATDTDGIALRAAFDAVEADLVRVHGAGERIDAVAPARSRPDGEPWMVS
jgi:hypothetical protein